MVAVPLTRLAKIYHLLQLPDQWVAKDKDLETRDYVYMRKHVFPVPPSFLYLADRLAELSEEEMVFTDNNSVQRPAYGSYEHIHKDAEGNVHKTNLKVFMDRIREGEKFFSEQPARNCRRRNWAKEMEIKTNIPSEVVGDPEEAELRKVKSEAKKNIFKMETLPKMSGNIRKVVDLTAYYRALQGNTETWQQGKSKIQTAITLKGENEYYNSRGDRLGYTFIVNPRARASQKSFMRPALLSVASQSRFNRTASSFNRPSEQATQAVHRYRLGNNAMSIGEKKHTFYNRLAERTEGVQVLEAARTNPQGYFSAHKRHAENSLPPTRVMEKSTSAAYGKTGGFLNTDRVYRDETLNAEDVDKADKLTHGENEDDPFKQFEDNQDHHNEKDKSEYDHEGEKDENVGDKDSVHGVPVNTQSNYHTAYKSFNTAPKEQLKYYDPPVQNIGTKGLKRNMVRTSSSKFFQASLEFGDDIFSQKVSVAKQYIHLVGAADPTKTRPNQGDTLSLYNKPMYSKSSDSMAQLLIKRSCRESAREVEEVYQTKARLAGISANQSFSSLKNALLTPDTTLYNDITNVNIPISGSRLIAFEQPQPKKTKAKPSTKSSSKK